MVRIFSWKIDFDRDLERGDRFIVFGKRHATPSALKFTHIF
jgi:hypothetical protein